MALKALTRAPGAALSRCELTFVSRQPIDLVRALVQHEAYETMLRALGVDVRRLSEAPDLPDAVFVEDAAIVVDEVALIPRKAVAARQEETASVAEALARYRELVHLGSAATLDGGDVLRIERDIFIGHSTRTNIAAIEQAARILEPLDYRVIPVNVAGCLHLKTACTYVGDNTVLINPDWVDLDPFRRFDCVRVPPDEPFGANILSVNGTVLMAHDTPGTARILTERDWDVEMLDISEFAKAEAGLTCMSILFNVEVLTMSRGMDAPRSSGLDETDD